MKRALTFSQSTSPINLGVVIAGKNQLTVKNVGADSTLKIKFADMSAVNLQFKAGDVANKVIKVKSMGTNPDTLRQLKENSGSRSIYNRV